MSVLSGFSAFAAGLSPFLSKSKQLQTALKKAREEIDASIIPALQSTMDTQKGVAFKSQFAKSLDRSFSDYPNLRSRNGTWIDTLVAAYPIIRKNIETLERIVAKYPNETISTSAMLWGDITITSYQNALLFTNAYTLTLLNVFWAAERNVLDGNDETYNLTPYEVKYISGKLVDYLKAMNALYTEPSKLEKAMADMPKTIFTPEEENTTFAIGDPKRFDPLGFRFIPLSINPWFKANMLRAEYQEERHRSLENDYKRISMRIQIMRARNQSQNDPAAEKMLEALEKRKRSIYAQLQKYEGE